MAKGKGKQSLKETLDESQIVETDQEINSPFWLITDDYGVIVNSYGYILVERKEKAKAIKDEKGNTIGAETYIAWEPSKYTSTFESCLLSYTQVAERKLFGKLSKCQDFRELVKIRLQIKQTIDDSFKIDGFNKDILKACDAVESHTDLEIKVSDATKMVEDAVKQTCDLMELIKEKRKIIVDNMPKEKKHRLKLED